MHPLFWFAIVAVVLAARALQRDRDHLRESGEVDLPERVRGAGW